MSIITSPNLPITTAPPGQTTNLVNPSDISYEVYIAAGVCLPLIIGFASLRYWAKAFIVKKWTWDDLTCALGLLATIAYTGVICAVTVGKVLGLHGWDITIGNFLNLDGQSVPHQRLAFVAQCLYPISIWIVKNSLFILYVQVFAPVRPVRIQAISAIVVTAAFYITMLAINISICAPRTGHSEVDYAASLGGPKCTNLGQKLSLVLSSANVILDLYLILLPLPTVWLMQMPLKKKIGVSSMFLTGTIACVASIVCLRLRFDTSDSTRSIIPLYALTIIEMSASIVVCCMPTAAVVFKHYKIPMVTRFSIYRHSRRIESNAGEIDQLPIYTGNATSHANVTGGRTLQKSKDASILVTTKYDRGDIIPLEPTNIFVTTSVDMTKEEKVKEKR